MFEMKCFKSTKENMKKYLKVFKQDPLNGLGKLIPILIVLAGSVGLLYAYILFLLNQGYGEQITCLKENGIEGIVKIFTLGQVEMMYKGVLPIVVCCLAGIEILVMVATMFKREPMICRILAAIGLGILVLFICFIGGILFVDSLDNELSQKVQEIVQIALYGPRPSSYRTLSLIIVCVVSVAALIFLIIVVIAKSRWMLWHCALALVISFVGLPLLLLLLENIIPLTIGIIVLGVVVLIFKFIPERETGLALEETYTAVEKNVAKSCSIVEEKGHNQIVKKFESNTVFWRDKGGNGVLTPTADCIYFKNWVYEKQYVCTVSDFEKGRVALVNKGVRVMSIAGCKTPER